MDNRGKIPRKDLQKIQQTTNREQLAAFTVFVYTRKPTSRLLFFLDGGSIMIGATTQIVCCCLGVRLGRCLWFAAVAVAALLAGTILNDLTSCFSLEITSEAVFYISKRFPSLGPFSRKRYAVTENGIPFFIC